MKYKVLISEAPIASIIEVELLRAMGLKIPFVPADPEFNIYAYVPDNIPFDLRKIRAIHYFEDHRLFISEKEYKAHFEKIEDFNLVAVGDKVKINGYKNLVTEVESIDGDLATTKINLRGFVYRFTKKLSHLSKSDVIYSNRSSDFQFAHVKKLYIDLAEYHHIQDPQLYIQEVFHLVLRLKLPNPAHSVSLINPRFGVAKLFGFQEVSVNSVPCLFDSTVTSKDLLYSNDFINWTDKCTFLSRIRLKSFRSIAEIKKDKFYHMLGLSSPQHLIIYRRLRHIAKKNGMSMVFNKDRIKYLIEHNDISLRKRFPDCFDLSSITIPPLILQHEFCVENVYNSLLELKQIKIAENLDYYMTILRG
jgi:hypothetical protein